MFKLCYKYIHHDYPPHDILILTYHIHEKRIRQGLFIYSNHVLFRCVIVWDWRWGKFRQSLCYWPNVPQLLLNVFDTYIANENACSESSQAMYFHWLCIAYDQANLGSIQV